MFTGSTNSNFDECLPKTLKEVYLGVEAELWKSAVEEELLSLTVTPITSMRQFSFQRGSPHLPLSLSSTSNETNMQMWNDTRFKLLHEALPKRKVWTIRKSFLQ